MRTVRAATTRAGGTKPQSSFVADKVKVSKSSTGSIWYVFERRDRPPPSPRPASGSPAAVVRGQSARPAGDGAVSGADAPLA
jgi:hypothetical protein